MTSNLKQIEVENGGCEVEVQAEDEQGAIRCESGGATGAVNRKVICQKYYAQAAKPAKEKALSLAHMSRCRFGN